MDALLELPTPKTLKEAQGEYIAAMSHPPLTLYDELKQRALYYALLEAKDKTP